MLFANSPCSPRIIDVRKEAERHKHGNRGRPPELGSRGRPAIGCRKHATMIIAARYKDWATVGLALR